MELRLKQQTLAQRMQQHYGIQFWDTVDQTDANGCWPSKLVTVARSGHVSQRFRKANNPSDKAHRAAFMLTWGDIPGDAMVLHTCNNPRCCNPFHLYAGTPQQNVQDSIAAGTFNGGGPWS